jgi:hypothetical protein
VKVAGFTIVRNALKFDYPVVESIMSVLPLCDVFYVGVGNSDDDTRQVIASVGSPKIVILDSVWDDALREGGQLLAIETNKVFDNIPLEFDWCFYIQADECIHEDDHAKIRQAMVTHLSDSRVDGLLFGYRHFYGQYNFIGVGRRWYSNEVRVIRNNKQIRSFKDAQGFRKTDVSKLRVKATGAFIYHYGWVKPPKAQQAKQQSFHKMWHDDEWLKKHVGNGVEFDYSNIDLLENYQGTHPSVMKERIASAGWRFDYDKKIVKRSLKYRVLYFVEKMTGWRIGENRNYRVI